MHSRDIHSIHGDKKTRRGVNLPGFFGNFRTLHRGYVFSLGSLQAFTDGEFDLLPFFEAFAAFTNDLAEMDKNVTLTFAGDKSVTFFVIEPFNGPGN